MMIDDVVIEKISIIKNCLRRILEITEGNPASLDNLDKQDAYVLNLQRAVQASIDLANITIRSYQFSMPSTYADSFTILQKEDVLTPEISEKMQRMCGFRNIAVHDYRKINIDILKSILTDHLQDFESFYQQIVSSFEKD